jgi:coenzyme F420-reducing hydrogenase beta subunit
MKPLKKAILAILFIGFGTFSIHAQSIHFQNSDGTKTSYNLEDVRKVTMENNKVQVHMKDGNLYERDMAALQNYRYDESKYHSGR